MLTAKEGSVDLATTRVATRLTLSVYALGTHTRHACHMLQAEAMGISDQRDSHDSMTGA